MAKMDKEALAKNKFWIGLGAFVLLWLIGLLSLQMSAGSPIEAKKKEFEKAEQGIKSWTSKAKNKDKILPAWEEHGKNYRDYKNSIWGQAWQGQKDLLKWPAGNNYARIWDESPSFDDWKKRMSDPTNGESTRLRDEYKNRYYVGGPKALFSMLSEEESKLAPQYSYHLEQAMAPVEFKNGKTGFETVMAPATGTKAATGEGRGGFGKGVAVGIPGGPNLGTPGDPSGARRGITELWTQVPSVEEIWLAQEDYSVKYELLQVVRRTVDSVARLTAFDYQPPKDQPLPPNTRAFGYKNSRWEVVLLVEKQGNNQFISKKSTIKNISPRVLLLSNPRTRGPLVFQLKQGTATYPLRLKGEPLPAGARTEIGEQFSVDLISFGQPVEMAQLFDWSTSPVRRIDDIRLGFNSHRTSNLPLIVSKHFSEEETPTDPSGATGTPGPGMDMGSTPPSGMPGGVPGMPGGLAGAAGAAKTTGANALVKNRYIQVTGQARSMPIALAVVVDQTHLHEFLTELANCQLRFQITQTQLRHVRDVTSLMEAATAPPTGPGTGMGEPGMILGPPRGGPGPGTPGTPGMPGTPNGGNTLDPNLVEVTVYGIATLYEKFSVPKDPTGGDPAASKP